MGCNSRFRRALCSRGERKDDNEEKRQKSRKMAAQTLEDLYKVQPGAKAEIQKSAGFGVVSGFPDTYLSATPPTRSKCFEDLQVHETQAVDLSIRIRNVGRSKS